MVWLLMVTNLDTGLEANLMVDQEPTKFIENFLKRNPGRFNIRRMKIKT